MSTQATAVVQSELNTLVPSPPNWPARYARFGQFQVDLLRDELFREGRRAKVQAKIFQALLVLIARPGEIITRDEVSRRLWPEALQATLDANVNTTINKLRAVLGDSSDSPAYIETIPRRGYSFVAAVQFTDEPTPSKPAGLDDAVRSQVSSSANPNRWLAFLRIEPAPLRLASFVLVGMLMGALLVLAWKFAANKTPASQNFGRQSVAVPAQPDRDL
jgi:DNA-binding winged helix-turn-helix (wHTH) protein